MVKNLKRVGFIGFFLLFFSLCNFSLSYANSSQSDILLDKLENLKSHAKAEVLRSKIWNLWVNAVSVKNQAQLKLALNEFESGRLGLAENAFSKIIETEPFYMEAWNKRATIRYLRGNFEGSLRDISEVLIREPRHFGAISGLALIYMSQKKYIKALESYRKLQNIDPTSRAAIHFIPILKIKISGKLT